MKTIHAGVLVTTLVTAACAAFSTRTIDGDVAFVNVTVVPMDAPRALTNQTVIVKGSRIEAIGPTATTRVAKRARIIDGSNRFLMPGLADMHGHINDKPSLTLLVANGVTTVRNMWGSRQILAWRDEASRSAVMAPTIITAGPIVDGVPPLWDGSTAVKDDREATDAVSRQHATGYDFVKVYNNLSREAYDAVVAEASRLGVPVAGHVPIAVGLEHALEVHQKSIEHLDGYFRAAQREGSPILGTRQIPPKFRLIEWLDEDKLARLVTRTKEAGSWNCPTLIVYRKFVPLDEGKALLARPEMRYVAPQLRASWDPTKDFRLKSLTADDFASFRRADARRLVLARQLHDAGARMMLGTDFSNPYVVPGFSIHEELGFLVMAGLTPYDAIRMGTVNAANYLGADFGEIAAGKRADLILTKGNPLDDVRNVSRRDGVMLRGHWYPEAELQRALEGWVDRFDPKHDRFAQFPSLGREGTAEIEPQMFHVRYSDVFAGQQRFAIDRLPEGRRSLRLQSALDEVDMGSATNELHETMDASGALVDAELRRSDQLGTFTASFRIVDGHLTGSAKFSSSEAVRLDEAVGSALFLPPLAASWQLLVERAKTLSVGQAIDIEGIDVDPEPVLHIVKLTEHVKRLPSVESERRYAVDEKRPNGRSHIELTIGSSGVLTNVHGALQIGEIDMTSAQRP
jgi:imidazolonepropionase-like amidohydrolase